MGLVGGPGPGPRRVARLTPFSATLHRPFGILPHQVPPYPRYILKPVTCKGRRAESGSRFLSALLPPTLGLAPILTLHEV